MGLPIGTIWETAWVGQLFGQRIYHRWHWRTVTPSAAATPHTETGEILNGFSELGVGKLTGEYLACMPENYELLRCTAQAIRTIRYAKRQKNMGDTGGSTAAFTANVAARITWLTALAGRSFVGGMSLPISPDNYAAGEVNSVWRTTLANFASFRLLNLTPPASVGVYEPVIIHPLVPGIPTTLVTGFTVQETVRVQRRRTVGLGE